MSAQAGNLHWKRARLILTGDGAGDNIDTGIKVAGRAYDQAGGPGNPVDPPLGLEQAGPPANGATPASRLMVVMLPPLSAWTGVTMGEPYLDTDTDTVHVVLTSNIEGGSSPNVLFWAPHTNAGPGKCDTYNAPIE
jgi:hypothetical protein